MGSKQIKNEGTEEVDNECEEPELYHRNNNAESPRRETPLGRRRETPLGIEKILSNIIYVKHRLLPRSLVNFFDRNKTMVSYIINNLTL
jgi:hypothetical protein